MKHDTVFAVRRCGGMLLGAALLSGAAGAGAPVFKWVDPKGVVHYSDLPPAGQQGRTELKSFAGAAPAPTLPYELAEAVRAHPVTLYTTAGCDACGQGRAMLKARGVPFAEKTVTSEADQEKLKQAGSPGRLPLLLVGPSRVIGFEPGSWHAALNAAAYPKQAMLPPNYVFALAEAAAPSPDVLARAGAAKFAPAPERQPPKAPPPPLNAPPNFQF